LKNVVDGNVINISQLCSFTYSMTGKSSKKNREVMRKSIHVPQTDTSSYVHFTKERG